MCGIAGFVSRDEHRDPREARAVLDSMCRVIAHRGPDDQGMLVDDRVALGMRRLSIIDLAGGRQPMSGCDGEVTIVFNGEIYNYRELQRELESRGHRFKTHSDTETIVHAYEEYGSRCVDHLRGMFAFAIWHSRTGELFIARDRVGKKPLYYTVTGGTLIFGSELKSVREHPEFRGEISVEALDAYLTFGYVPDPLTIFRDVHKLPPGHHLTFRDGRVSVEQYWDFPYEYARIAAQRFGTDHHEFIVSPDICEIVDGLVWHFDEPFADSSAISTYMVSKLARQHVTVALSGDGGDELFAGYTRYALDRKRSGFANLPRVVRQGVMQPLGRNLPHGAWGRNYLHNVALDPLDRYIEEVSVFTRLNKPSLYTNDFRQQLGTCEAAQRFRDCAAHSRADDSLDPLLYLDSKTYLPGDILTKVDRMSMAVSLEARVPLLDHKLIEFVCTRIPASMKMKGLDTKHIFKRAMRDLVPAEILDRPKQGFGIPIDQWINQQLRERVRGTLTEPRTMQRGFIETRYVNLLLDEHERGRRDHATELWTLFMLELWHRKFVDAPGGIALSDHLNQSLAPIVA